MIVPITVGSDCLPHTNMGWTFFQGAQKRKAAGECDVATASGKDGSPRPRRRRRSQTPRGLLGRPSDPKDKTPDEGPLALDWTGLALTILDQNINA